jgi:hypothetical protein
MKSHIKKILLGMVLLVGFLSALVSCVPNEELTVYSYPEATVESFSPVVGKIGSLVTITGTNFGIYPKAAAVYFGTTLATIVSIEDNKMVVKVPDGATGPITVRVWTKTTVTKDSFTILPSAKIDGISPAIGGEGTLVSINGVNFGTNLAAIAVKFNNGTLDAEIVSVTDNKIVVKAPTNVQPGYISVIVDGIELQTTSFNAGYLNYNFNIAGSKDGWDITNNASYTVSGGFYNVTFDPALFLGTNKRRADFKLTAGATIHAGNFPIIAIKFNKPATMNLIFDVTGGSYGNGNNKWTGIIPDRNNNGKNIYYYDLVTGRFGASSIALSQTVPTTLATFQFKIADITSSETGYSVDWVKSFTSLAELQDYAARN